MTQVNGHRSIWGRTGGITSIDTWFGIARCFLVDSQLLLQSIDSKYENFPNSRDWERDHDLIIEFKQSLYWQLIYLALRTLYSGLLGSYSDMLLVLITVSTLLLTDKHHQFAFIISVSCHPHCYQGLQFCNYPCGHS